MNYRLFVLFCLAWFCSTGTVFAQVTDKHGDTRATATTISLSTSVSGLLSTSASGTIEPATDVDYFKITITEPLELHIFTTGNLDTLGRLRNSNGGLIDSNDDAGMDSLSDTGGFLPSSNFLITANLQVGTYFIEVNDCCMFYTGDYVLHVEQAIDDHGNVNDTATIIQLNTPVSGTIDPITDVDYFKITLTEPTRVDIFTTGNLDTAGELRNSNDVLLEKNEDADDDGTRPGITTGTNFLITASLQAEIYFIRVTNSDVHKATGNYILHVNSISSISFEQDEYMIAEGTTGTVILEADPPPMVKTRIELMATSTMILNSEYQLSTTVLVFEPNQSTASFEVSILNDVVVQLPRELRLSFNLLDNNAVHGTIAETVIRVKDNAVPIAGLAVGSNVFSEAAASVALRVTLDRMFAEETSITIVIDSGGSATRNADYTINTGPLVLPANSTSVETILTVNEDDRVEGDETIELSLNAYNDLIVDTLSTARLTLTIEDNDIPAIRFEEAEYTIVEGFAGTVTLQADQPPVVETRIELTTLTGTTVAEDEYSLFPAEIVFGVGEDTVLFRVGIVDDVVVQSTRTLSFSFDFPDSNAKHGATSETVISVANDDIPGVTLTVAGDVTRLEEGASAMLRITLTHAFDQETSITIVTDGTAILDTDYTISINPVVFEANSISAETTLRITIDEDESEQDETIILTLEAANPLVMGDGPEGAKLTLTIGKAMLFFRIKVFLEGAQ